MSMKTPFVKYGVYLGLGMVVLTLLFYFVSPRFYLTWGSWVGYLLAIVMMIMAAKEHKNIQGGFISFREAFTSSWMTSVIGFIIATLFSYILITVIDPSLIDTVKEISVEAIDKMEGFIGEEAAEEAREQIENDNPFSLGKQFLGLFFTFIIGAIISLIIAAVYKRERTEFS